MTAGESYRQRLGYPVKEKERSLWVIGDTDEAFESFSPVIDALALSGIRLNVIFSADDPNLRARLAKRFPDRRVSALPYGNPLSVKTFLARGNVRAAVVLESAKSCGPVLVAGLNRRAVTLLAFVARPGAALPASETLRACEFIIDAGAARDRPADRSTTTRRMSYGDAAALLIEALGRDLKARQNQGERLNPLWRFIVDHREHRALRWRIRRYADVHELRTALAHPSTILCLGNGPSSEDESLDGLAHDALFRVNHGWLQRGYLARPDVVFTGGKPTMRAVSGAIFGLNNAECEHRLIAQRFFNPMAGTIRYFDVPTIAPLLEQFAWGSLRPTNGACMLAAAVALNPDHLIVAGIDLFQHPDGSYPGDQTTPNAFSPAHSREAELAFILSLFARYHGRLTIIGDVLNEAWQRYGSAATREDGP